jgi:hypothetical protein
LTNSKGTRHKYNWKGYCFPFVFPPPNVITFPIHHEYSLLI